MTNEEKKAIVRRFFEAFEANDHTTIKEVTAPDLTAYLPGAPGPQNREGMLQGISDFSAAFSDRRLITHELIAEGRKVAARTSMTATHTGDYQGQPPTGRQIVINGLSIEHIEEGKIVERWLAYDLMDLMQQLGLVPPPQSEG
ncbi:MAG: ester cyclase [Anaerolineales bacterium]|jgi:steroid delta-isomerase-like uncharacterized protein